MYSIAWVEDEKECELKGSFNSVIATARVFESNDIDFKVKCLNSYIAPTTACIYDYKHWLDPNAQLLLRKQ